MAASGVRCHSTSSPASGFVVGALAFAIGVSTLPYRFSPASPHGSQTRTTAFHNAFRLCSAHNASAADAHNASAAGAYNAQPDQAPTTLPQGRRLRHVRSFKEEGMCFCIFSESQTGSMTLRTKYELLKLAPAFSERQIASSLPASISLENFRIDHMTDARTAARCTIATGSTSGARAVFTRTVVDFITARCDLRQFCPRRINKPHVLMMTSHSDRSLPATPLSPAVRTGSRTGSLAVPTNRHIVGGRYRGAPIDSEAYLLLTIELNLVCTAHDPASARLRWSTITCMRATPADPLVTPHALYRRPGRRR